MGIWASMCKAISFDQIKYLKKFREVTKIIESTNQKRDNDSVAPP